MASLGPVITLMNSDNTSAVDTWNVGTVQAQTPSAPLIVNIWNNKGNNTEDHSDLKECTLSVLDANGNTAVGDVARDKWVQCKMNGESDSQYIAIGGSDPNTVTALVKANDASVEVGTIKGTRNDGVATNSTGNVATVYFRINAPINSIPGTKTFKIRLTGYYT